MATYNAKTLTLTKYNTVTQEVDEYIIDPMQGNDTGYNDIPVTIHTSDWSGTAPYTYVYSDNHITANSTITVFFKDGVREGLVGDLKFTKGTGTVTFVTTEPAVGDIPLVVRVIDGMVNGVYPIDATMVETDAVVGETTVQGALEDLNDRLGDAETSIGTVPEGSTLQGEISDLSTKMGTVPSGKNLQGEISDTNTELGNNEAALAIVVTGDVAPAGGLEAGKYIFLKGHSTLPTGGYHVKSSNINAGTTLSLSNLTADTEGIANGLDDKMASLNSNITKKCDDIINGFAVLCSGNTHPWIAGGKYMYIYNHSTLSNGLYITNKAIAANDNPNGKVTAVSDGGLNELNSKITTYYKRVKVVTGNVTFNANGQADITHNLGTQNIVGIMLPKAGIIAISGSPSSNNTYNFLNAWNDGGTWKTYSGTIEMTAIFFY